MSIDNVLNFLKDCYINDKSIIAAKALFDKKIPVQEWEEFKKIVNVDEFTLFNKEKIVNIILYDNDENFDKLFEFYENNDENNYEKVTDFLFSLGNLNFVLNFQKYGPLLGGYFWPHEIIKSNANFKEFHKKTKTGIEFFPIHEFKFDYVFQYLINNFNFDEYPCVIKNCSDAVELCNYLGVEIRILGESPANFVIEKYKIQIKEYEIQEFYEENKEENKKVLLQFAKLFSKPTDKWFGTKCKECGCETNTFIKTINQLDLN